MAFDPRFKESSNLRRVLNVLAVLCILLAALCVAIPAVPAVPAPTRTVTAKLTDYAAPTGAIFHARVSPSNLVLACFTVDHVCTFSWTAPAAETRGAICYWDSRQREQDAQCSYWTRVASATPKSRIVRVLDIILGRS